jgi:hypothetical protein
MVPEIFERFDAKPGGLPRAPRYHVQLMAHYRRDANDPWRDAVTINLSRSGVLFSTSADIEPDMPLELSILLAVDRSGTSEFTTIECQCRSVRVERRLDRLDAESDGSGVPGVLVAAMIERYTFSRGASYWNARGCGEGDGSM